MHGEFQRPALDGRIHVQITTGSADQVVNKSWMQLHELESKFPVQARETVNATIVPEPNTEGLAGEKWLINPQWGL